MECTDYNGVFLWGLELVIEWNSGHAYQIEQKED